MSAYQCRAMIRVVGTWDRGCAVFNPTPGGVVAAPVVCRMRFAYPAYKKFPCRAEVSRISEAHPALWSLSGAGN